MALGLAVVHMDTGVDTYIVSQQARTAPMTADQRMEAARVEQYVPAEMCDWNPEEEPAQKAEGQVGNSVQKKLSGDRPGEVHRYWAAKR